MSFVSAYEEFNCRQKSLGNIDFNNQNHKKKKLASLFSKRIKGQIVNNTNEKTDDC